MANSRPRRSARKREPPQKFEPTEASSPTRPNKRRKARAATPVLLPRAPPAQDEAQSEAGDDVPEEEDEDEDMNETQQLVADAVQVIPYLFEAPHFVNVQEQHPEAEQTVQAYAKIAGKRWTFYARTPRISIGRQGDRKSGDDDPEEDPPDIDLGPGKHVSRAHAEIRFSDDDRWHLRVTGRNGAKVNNLLIKKGQEACLQSGDVIEIAETEMIFIAPDVKAVVEQEYLDRMKQTAGPSRDIRAVPQQAAWSGQAHAHPGAAGSSQYQGPMHISPYGPPTSEPGTTTAARPMTPNNPLLQHPYLAQTAQPMKAASMTPGQQQPVTIESSEQVDYSNNSNKDIKPPMSYATLIAQAILAGPNEKSSLNNIYEWIKRNFAYYRHIDPSWQNSIRHNLSLNQAFQKAPRETHEPGKGGMWYIIPEKKDEYKRSGWKMTSRGGARPSSNPSSPAPNKNKSPKRRTPPRQTGNSNFANQTPPANHVAPSSLPSRTPLRQATNVGSVPKLDPTPQLMDDNSPLPVRSSFLNSATNAAGSPPMLSSSAFLDDHQPAGGPYTNPFTPAPRRQDLTFINAPSTSKLPSQYLLQSSPAPFWKGLGTPAPLPQTSPVKAEVGAAPEVPASSSPPPPQGVNGSPTRSRGRSEVGLGIHQPSRVVKDQPDNAPLDLMGNFPKIGDARPTNAAH